MAILEKIITLYDVTGGFNCTLENYGSMRDTIGHFSYNFKPGIYIFEGECATGGWALSTILSGKDKLIQGQIRIDDKIVCNKELQKYGCYVGEDAGLKKWFGLVDMSVLEQIEYGIKNKLSYSNSVEEIKRIFKLSDERIKRKIKYFSGERWKASMAIGYALGKRIYCFPWMNSKLILQLENCLKTCCQPLLESDATIIIPTTSHQVLKSIFQHFTIIST